MKALAIDNRTLYTVSGSIPNWFYLRCPFLIDGEIRICESWDIEQLLQKSNNLKTESKEIDSFPVFICESMDKKTDDIWKAYFTTAEKAKAYADDEIKHGAASADIIECESIFEMEY